MKHDTIYLEHKGERHTLREWSKIIGKPRETIYRRWCRGWETADILEKPTLPTGPTYSKKNNATE